MLDGQVVSWGDAVDNRRGGIGDGGRMFWMVVWRWPLLQSSSLVLPKRRPRAPPGCRDRDVIYWAPRMWLELLQGLTGAPCSGVCFHGCRRRWTVPSRFCRRTPPKFLDALPLAVASALHLPVHRDSFNGRINPPIASNTEPKTTTNTPGSDTAIATSRHEGMRDSILPLHPRIQDQC